MRNIKKIFSCVFCKEKIRYDKLKECKLNVMTVRKRHLKTHSRKRI